MEYIEITENSSMSFLEWLNKEAPYWLLRGLQRIGLPQRGIYTYFGSRVHISLWEYRKGEIHKTRKKETHFVEALHLPFAVGHCKEKGKLAMPFLCTLAMVNNR